MDEVEAYRQILIAERNRLARMPALEHRAYTPEEVTRLAELTGAIEAIYYALQDARAAAGPPAAARPSEDDAAARVLDAAKEITSLTYDRGSVYTTAVVAAGFAGAFAIWANLHAEIPRIQNIIVGGLLALSLAAFVSYEVFKVFQLTGILRRRGAAFALAPIEALALLRRIDEEERQKLPAVQTAWRLTFLFTVVTGGAAAVILLANLLIAGTT